jgi:hypothetical protein
MAKKGATISSPVKGPVDEHPQASSESFEVDCCEKAFNAESARFEDADEPCRNGEG